MQTIVEAAISAAERERELAASYDPRPGDLARLETAIARRNTAWDRQREAAALYDSLRRRGVDGAELVGWVLDLNDANRELEHAIRDLIRERVRYESDGVPW